MSILPIYAYIDIYKACQSRRHVIHLGEQRNNMFIYVKDGKCQRNDI